MRKSGITKTTPKDMLLGAGTVFKNLKYVYHKSTEEGKDALLIVEDDAAEDAASIRLWKVKEPGVSFIGVEEGYTPAVGDYIRGEWNDTDEHVLGATSGGNKLTIKSELMDIEVDDVQVKVKGLTQKVGEEGSLETNLAQHSEESLIRAIIGEKAKDGLLKGFTEIRTKSLVEASDYLDNIAFVGNMTDGTSIIVIMENVICTSGLQLDGKNKDKAVISVKFECTADFNAGRFDTLPIYIFYPDKTERNQQVPETEEPKAEMSTVGEEQVPEE